MSGTTPLLPLLRTTFVALALCATGRVHAQADGSEKWRYATMSSFTQGNILSSPAVAPDGTMYIGVEVGASTSPNPVGRLFALTASGSPKWSSPFTTPDWIDATPALASDGTIYVGCWDGKLYAVRPDGTQKWALSLGAFISAPAAIGTDGTIYVGTGDGNLCAVNPDGTLKWQFATLFWIEAAPAIGPDGTLYIGSLDNNFYAVNPDGTEKWRYAVGNDIASSAAIAADGTIYVGCRDLKLYAFNANGTVKWTFATTDFIDASPVLAPDGTVYCATTGGRLFALNPDGTEKWRYPAAGQTALDGIYSTPAVRADGTIIFGCSDARVYAVKSDGTLLWRATVGYWADSSPAVTADGTIYIGCSDKNVYAFNGSSPALATDWPQLLRTAERTGRQPMGSAPGTTGRLTNLSVRTFAGADASTLAVGYTVSGSGSRSMLVRGVGPTLATFSVPGVLADPRITFYRGQLATAENDNWGQAANAGTIASTGSTLQAFPLPDNSLDAAFLGVFPAGIPETTTVQVTGNNNATGIALLELYDVSGDSSARLVNVSARSMVSTGGGVLIAGFVVAQNTRAILVRGVGPRLGTFGVPGTLNDPQLRVYDSRNVLVAENDDWSKATNVSAKVSAANATFAFGLESGSKDSVLLLTLPPGSYTAQVSGANNTTGVALVEVYEVP